MLKIEARTTYLAKRKKLSENDILNNDAKISKNLISLLNNYEINILGTYIPIAKKNEIDAWNMALNHLKEDLKIQLALPKINILGTMDFFTSHKNTSFAKNKWEILEPIDENLVNPLQLDAILIPLLCFTPNGYRVGYGKGFYDKYLTSCKLNILKIGLSYFEPEPKITDINEFDIPLNFCITPHSIYEF